MHFSTGLIFLFIVLDIVFYYLQKQQEEDDGGQKNSSSSLSGDKQCRRFSLAEIKLATHDFDDAFVIGKGGFGKVYKGTINFGAGIDVAIKRLNLDSNQGATEFWAEIEMLSKFRHSHIVSLLGYHKESGEREMILVYEYMPNGSLEDHLHKRRANCSPLTWVQRLRICIGAARGLDYLHTGTGVQHRVIHRDVKSSNILVDENWAGKISDFGLSRTGPAYQSRTTDVYTNQIRGTFGYMDAEYFATHRLTRKSDVYAFGVVLFEVLCGRPAVDFTLDEKQHSLAGWAKHCVEEGTIDQIVDPCFRGDVSTSCVKKLAQIAYKCLLRSPKDRPTMTEVVARLEFVLTLTLQKHSRVTIVEKAKSFISMKFPVFNPKKKAIKTEKQPTTVAEGGSHHGGATTSREPVLPRGQIATPNLKMYTFTELRSATKNFRRAAILGEGGFGSVFKGWVDGVTYAPSKAGVGIPVAIKKSNPDSLQGLEEWQGFNTKLSDFGLAKLGPINGESYVSTRVMGTYGYAAPEYIETGHFYVKSDVYGFGVVMLEMITGLRALDRNRPRWQHNLVEWAKPELINTTRLRRIMDPRLEQVYPSKGAIKVAELILNCLDSEPNRRPSMEKVVASLEEINAIRNENEAVES